MKTLYLECNMGAAGDMLTAALLELHPDAQDFIKRFNALQIPGVHMEREDSEKCGICGTHMVITVNGEEEESCDILEHELHDHREHVHEYEGVGHRYEEHDHEHEIHGHRHEEHNHEHEIHGHRHEEHDHEHEIHGHRHEEHNHEHEIHGHRHEEHNHEHEMHGHEHEIHGRRHEEHDHKHEMHTHTHQGHHAHSHTSMADITAMIQGLNLAERVKKDAIAVYQLIAEAESHAHGKPVEAIHFHEVGTMDAVADVVGVCMLMHELRPERVVASPVHVGSGHVRCAHGVLPVPAPAAAYILRGVPIYGGQIRGELCTPTGAALLKHFVEEFGSMPVLRVEKIGYGMGKKDFEMANCVRAMWGES